MEEQTILSQINNGVATITLNRPDVHNAFDDILIVALTSQFLHLEQDDSVRIIVLKANGKSFSAGADVNWMRRMISYSNEENFEDAIRLAELMRTINQLSKPTIAIVQGAAYGGGVGLVACCDIAIASEQASFCLSEVKLGIMPAVISPYVIKAIGPRMANRYFLSAEQFDAKAAYRMGLVHEMVKADELDHCAQTIVKALKQGGPAAQAATKSLIAKVDGSHLDEELIIDTASRISRLRVTEEGQEGLSAFLEKRKPAWLSGD